MADKMLNNCSEAFSWKNELIGTRQRSNGDLEFKVLVVANFQDSIISETLNGVLQVNGYHACFIELADGKRFISGEAPMSFWSDRQDYKYFPLASVLTITGTHPNLGPYSVDLHTS